MGNVVKTSDSNDEGSIISYDFLEDHTKAPPI